MSMSFRKSDFRFGHNASMPVVAGSMYVLDPMADDLVAERILDGCRNTAHNSFLAWIEGGGAAIRERAVDKAELEAAEVFQTALEDAAGILTPTKRYAAAQEGFA